MTYIMRVISYFFFPKKREQAHKPAYVAVVFQRHASRVEYRLKFQFTYWVGGLSAESGFLVERALAPFGPIVEQAILPSEDRQEGDAEALWGYTA